MNGRLIIAALAVAGLWAGWWLLGSSAYESGLRAWLAAQPERGWRAQAATLDTVGFPSRFDTTLTDVRITDPGGGVEWSAPFVQILSLAYRPTEIIAAIAPRHRLILWGSGFDIAQDMARASIFLEARPSLPLDRAIAIIDGLAIAPDAGGEYRMKQARFAMERVPATAATYRLGAELTALTPGAALGGLLDPGGRMPQTIDRIRLDARTRLSAPVDRRALVGGAPRIERIELTEFAIDWGPARLAIRGEIDVDATGVPEGRLVVQARDWRRILGLGAAAGLIPPESRDSLENALEALAASDGDPDTVELPLTLRNGTAALGPLPLGAVPRLPTR